MTRSKYRPKKDIVPIYHPSLVPAHVEYLLAEIEKREKKIAQQKQEIKHLTAKANALEQRLMNAGLARPKSYHQPANTKLPAGLTLVLNR